MACRGDGTVAGRRRAERRSTPENGQGEAKVYTNEDLVRRDGSAPPAAVAAAPAGATAPEKGAADPRNAAAGKPGAAPDGKGEHMEETHDSAQQSLNRNKVLQAALEARVNALNTDFVNTDDPIQRNAIVQENLKAAMAELERMKAEVAAGTKAITDIQEEARKANVPPGWLR